MFAEQLIVVRTPLAARRWAKFLGLGLGLMAAVGLGELLARLALPPVRAAAWYHNDARYGVRHRANLDTVSTEWGDGELWQVRTNHRGFRRPEWTAIPREGTMRVLVVGDSFAFGNGVDESEAFPWITMRALQADGSPWEVVNLGVSGWGPQNALAYLETEGGDIEAQCLVYAFFEGNDVMDNVVNGPYELDGGEWRRREHVEQRPGPFSLVRSWLRRMPIYDLLLAHSQLFNLARSAAINVRDRFDARAAEARLYREAGPEELARALVVNDATLDRMSRLAAERFGRFALLTIPMRGQLVEDSSKAATPYPAWIGQRTHEHVLQWAERAAVPVVDLHRHLPSAPPQLATLYFRKDLHLSADGNRFVGHLLAERLPTLCGEARVEAGSGGRS